MKKNVTTDVVSEEIVRYISQNGIRRSIKPVFKADDFVLYNEDCLEVMSRLPDNYVDMIFITLPNTAQVAKSL
jgi:hypothetical protein